jgi:hypothetical protein
MYIACLLVDAEYPTAVIGASADGWADQWWRERQTGVG